MGWGGAYPKRTAESPCRPFSCVRTPHCVCSCPHSRPTLPPPSSFLPALPPLCSSPALSLPPFSIHTHTHTFVTCAQLLSVSRLLPLHPHPPSSSTCLFLQFVSLSEYPNNKEYARRHSPTIPDNTLSFTVSLRTHTHTHTHTHTPRSLREQWKTHPPSKPSGHPSLRHLPHTRVVFPEELFSLSLSLSLSPNLSLPHVDTRSSIFVSGREDTTHSTMSFGRLALPPPPSPPLSPIPCLNCNQSCLLYP